MPAHLIHFRLADSGVVFIDAGLVELIPTYHSISVAITGFSPG